MGQPVEGGFPVDEEETGMTIAFDFSERSTGTELPRGDNRQSLLQAIAALARERPGSANINAIAIKLSTRYPQSGLTIDEICRRIGQAISGDGPAEHPGR
jgi:hypothetical protein